MDWKVLHLSLSLSLFFSLFLYLSPIIYLPTDLSVYLSIYLSIYLSVCLSPYLSIYLPIYLSSFLAICLSIYLSFFLIYLSIYLSFYQSIYLSLSLSLSLYLSISLSLCLSVYLSICKFENEAILRDFLSFWTWQHQKLRNSTRLPQFLNLTTSKTKQSCETSSFFEVDDIKNKRILRDFLQKWKVECRADGLVPMRFAIFPLHLSKVLRLPRKINARSYEVLHLSRKIISANLKIWGSKIEPLTGNQRPDFLTSLITCLLYCAGHATCIFADPLQMSHACQCFWNCHKTLTFCSLLTRCTIPCAYHAKRHLNV